MGLIATVGLFIGFTVCLVLLVVIIELYCWKLRKNRLERPYLVSMISSMLVAIATIILMNVNSSGESGFIVMIAAPFILLGSALGGVPIGALYRRLDRTIIIKKPKEPVINKKFSVRL